MAASQLLTTHVWSKNNTISFSDAIKAASSVKGHGDDVTAGKVSPVHDIFLLYCITYLIYPVLSSVIHSLTRCVTNDSFQFQHIQWLPNQSNKMGFFFGVSFVDSLFRLEKQSKDVKSPRLRAQSNGKRGNPRWRIWNLHIKQKERRTCIREENVGVLVLRERRLILFSWNKMNSSSIAIVVIELSL